MLKFKKSQFLIIAIAAVLVVLLLLLPRTGENEPEKVEVSTPETAGNYLDGTVASLSENEQDVYFKLKEDIASTEDPLDKIELIDSMSRFWEKRGEVLLAADELYEVAEIISDKPSYFIAGDKYYLAFQEEQNADRKKISLEKAIASYSKVLEENPDDLDAKTSLAVCYVEGSQLLGEAPMKGIGLLREVLEQDPNNINALVNLGYFSTKSGQYDKAIERYEQVLSIDPDFSDAYLYLSDVYLKKGDNQKAADYLEEYKRFLKDPTALEQLNEYIDRIRNNNLK